MSEKLEYVAALDLGQTSTRAAIAETPPGGVEDATRLRLLGLGEAESRGWVKGSLADMTAAVASIRAAAEQAEAMADGLVMESAILGTGGAHVRAIGSHAGTLLSRRGAREVTGDDVARLIAEVASVPLAADREILHVLPREFVLDSRGGIRQPVGLMGTQLAAHGHVITGSVSVGQNLVACVNRAGVMAETVASEAFAAAEAITTAEERGNGVIVAVVGGASCELIAYRHGGVCLSVSVPVGGEHFTGDLAIGLHASRADAEAIKQSFGTVAAGWRHTGTTFEVPEIGRAASRLIEQSLLREILEARAVELFALIREELRRASLDDGIGNQMEGGIVLAGGGARLSGLCDLAERVLEMPARIGLPPRVLGFPEAADDPQYTVLFSLLHYALRVRRHRAPHGARLSSPWKHLFEWKS